MTKGLRVCLLVLFVVLLFLIGWWRHHHPFCDDDEVQDDTDNCPHPYPTCESYPFGEIRDISLYSRGSIAACNTQVEGRVAANGPIELDASAIGSGIQEPNKYTLVSSDSVSWDYGAAWKGAIVGSSVDVNTVTIVYDGIQYSSDECCPDDSCNLCSAVQEFPLDFDAVEKQLAAMEEKLDRLPATGVSVHEDDKVILECTDEEWTVFDVDQTNGFKEIHIHCPNRTALIRYDESVSNLDNVSTTITEYTSKSEILHYFKTEELTMESDGNAVFYGTVFAPNAVLAFSGGYINGNVIIASYDDFTGGCNSGTITIVPFTGCIPVECEN